jgi:hypothetical protein
MYTYNTHVLHITMYVCVCSIPTLHISEYLRALYFLHDPVLPRFTVSAFGENRTEKPVCPEQFIYCVRAAAAAARENITNLHSHTHSSVCVPPPSAAVLFPPVSISFWWSRGLERTYTYIRIYILWATRVRMYRLYIYIIYTQPPEVDIRLDRFAKTPVTGGGVNVHPPTPPIYTCTTTALVYPPGNRSLCSVSFSHIAYICI